MDPQLLLFCCFAVLFVLCFLSPISDGPQPAPSTASNLRAKTSNFDRFAVLWFRVSNLLAMAPQPAFDGLQPKSEDLQL